MPVGYGEKYRLIFDDVHTVSPAEWQVEFWFKDYDGSEGRTDLIGSGNPLVITRGENGQDRMVPIVGSKAEIEIIVTDDKFDKEQFFSVQQFQIKVDIRRNGIIWWSGYVKPDYCEFPYQPAPYPFKIIATDGIALLKNNLVDLTYIKEDNQLVSILNLIMERGLFETNTGYDNLRVISSLHRVGKEATFENLSTRYELWVDDKGAYMNIYDILTQIATSFTGRFFADNGAFWFQRIADLVNPDPTVWQYFTYNSPPTKTTTIDNFFKILKGDISSAEMIYLNNDSYITIMAPYKQSLIDLNYKFRTWLQNGDWHDWDGTNFAHWHKNITTLDIDQHGEGTEDDPYKMFFGKWETDTGILWQSVPGIPNRSSLRLETKIDFYKTERTAFRLYITKTAQGSEDPSDDALKLFAYRNGSWIVLAQEGTQGPKPGDDDNNFINRSGENGSVNVNFEIPPFNAVADFDYDHGNTFSFLLYILDPDGSFSEDVPYNGMEVEEIKLSVIVDGYTGETYTNRTGKNYSKYNEIENFTLIDDISTAVANKLYYPGESEDQLWTSDEIPFAIDNFQAMALFSTMNIYDSPFELMTGTYYSNKLHFFNTIQRAFGEYKLFMQLYDEYHVKHCEHRMTLAEIKKNIGIDPGTTSIRKFKIK